MKPFTDIILEGKAQRFVSNFPKIMKLQAHYTRDKVVRSYIVLMSMFTHCAEDRKDLFGAYMHSCVDSNDNFIELFNSLISRSLPKINDLDFDDVFDTSILVCVKRDIMDGMEKSTHFGDDTDDNHAESSGEFLREEKKHMTRKARQDHPHYHDFLKKWFHSLSKVKVTEARFKTEGMNTIDALIKNGQQRILSDVLPKYEFYLEREFNRNQRQGGGGAGTDEYTTYINNNFTEHMLECAINLIPRAFTAEEKEFLKRFKNKPQTIEKIKLYYTKYELNEIVITNNISSLTAKQMLDDFKQSKRRITARREEEASTDDVRTSRQEEEEAVEALMFLSKITENS